MSRILFLGVLLAIYLAIDVYSYNGLKTIFQSKLYNYIYWATTVFFVFGIVRTVFFFQDFSGVRPLSINLILGLVFTIFVVKLLLSVLFVGYDFGRIFIGSFQYVKNLVNPTDIEGGFVPGRRKAVAGVIAGIAAIPFIGFLYGITKGKYNYQINKISLVFDDLPDAFDGFRMVQISDIHAGSYDSIDQVHKGIEMVNSLDADMVVFTGDLVNSDKDEIDPYLSVFEEIEAKEGKFSITGNHDYYGNRSKRGEDREAYWNDFLSKHEKMGFDILMNENRLIKRGNDTIRLVGVENWGKGPFPKHADLNKALADVGSDEFTVLLSHDPTHWDEFTLKHDKKVHLTLSGHTHGMQFGINALGIKWSPIKFRYKKWAGLYTELGQNLYINKGFGFLGFPGRVGMYPEITEITFSKA